MTRSKPAPDLAKRLVAQNRRLRRILSTYKRHLLWDIEEAFRTLKGDLAVGRSITKSLDAHRGPHLHRLPCLLSARHPRPSPEGLAPGLTPRSLFEKFSAVQMIDVHIPTTDGRELQLTRYTQPETELMLLLERLRLDLPDQPPPKITAAQAAPSPPCVVPTLPPRP